MEKIFVGGINHLSHWIARLILPRKMVLAIFSTILVAELSKFKNT